MRGPDFPVPLEVMSPLQEFVAENSCNSALFENRLNSIKFVSDKLAYFMQVDTVFNESFDNCDGDPVLFKASIVDDQMSGVRVFKHLDIFSMEFLNALYRRILLSAGDVTRANGLRSAWFSACRCDYPYGRGVAQRNPQPLYLQLLTLLVGLIYKKHQTPYNAAHINYFFRNAKLGAHADDEHLLGENPNILSLSLGATRKFVLTENSTGMSDGIDLMHGSLLQMEGTTQEHYKHAVPPCAKYDGPRLNITFRTVVNCRCLSPSPLLYNPLSEDLHFIRPNRMRWYAS